MTTSAIAEAHSPERGVNLFGEQDIKELLARRVVITDPGGYSHLPMNAKYEMCIIIHEDHTDQVFGWYLDFLGTFYTLLVCKMSKNHNVLIVSSMEDAIGIARELEEKGHMNIFFFGSTKFLEQYANMFDDVYIIDQVEPHPGRLCSGYSSGLPFIWGGSAWQIWESFRRFEDPLLGKTHLETRGTHFRKVGRRNIEFEGRGLVLTASR